MADEAAAAVGVADIAAAVYASAVVGGGAQSHGVVQGLAAAALSSEGTDQLGPLPDQTIVDGCLRHLNAAGAAAAVAAAGAAAAVAAARVGRAADA